MTGFRKIMIVSTGLLRYSKNSDGSEDHNPGIPAPAYEALKTDFPQFEKIAAVSAITNNQVTVLGNDPNSDVALSKKFIETTILAFTHPEYFDMFHAKWLAGTAKTLSQPGNVVIDKPAAIKYFGDWKNAIGQYLKLDNTILLKVSGIIEEMPENSDFRIKLFGSYETLKQFPENYNYSTEWGSLSSNHQVYVMLPPNVSTVGDTGSIEGICKKTFYR